MYPGSEARARPGDEDDGAAESWSHYLARSLEWAAHTLTVEAYLPAAVTRQLSGPEALRENAAPLTIALFTILEIASPRSGATLRSLCEHVEGPSAAGAPASRGALIRGLFSVSSLLACDSRTEVQLSQLRLSLLAIERVLEGGASHALLLQVDLGGGLPLWQVTSGRITEATLPSPQPLLAAAHTLIAGLLVQNLRRAAFHPELYLQALTLLQRLLLLQQRSSQKLPLLKWAAVWGALFDTAAFIGVEKTFAQRGVAEVGLKLLQLINLFIALGDELFPTAATFESFAYELVRRHRTFEALYKVARRHAPRMVDSLSLARSLIVGALDTLSKMEPAAAANMSAADAIEIVRTLRLSVPSSQAMTALTKPPPHASPHDQLALTQSLLRVLLAHCRAEGLLLPLHFEELVAQ